MTDCTSLYPHSEKVKKALLWLSENLEKRPTATREKLLQEAEIRFDLCPADCAFLDKNFSAAPSANDHLDEG